MRYITKVRGSNDEVVVKVNDDVDVIRYIALAEHALLPDELDGFKLMRKFLDLVNRKVLKVRDAHQKVDSVIDLTALDLFNDFQEVGAFENGNLAFAHRLDSDFIILCIFIFCVKSHFSKECAFGHLRCLDVPFKLTKVPQLVEVLSFNVCQLHGFILHFISC